VSFSSGSVICLFGKIIFLESEIIWFAKNSFDEKAILKKKGRQP